MWRLDCGEVGLGDESQKEKGERLDERVSKQFREKTVA